MSATIIPPMTDPMGKYWTQPDPSRFLIDDTHVLMSEADFAKLPTYSSSIPSGVYGGRSRSHYVIVN